MIRGQRPKLASLKLATGNPGKRTVAAEPPSPPLDRPPRHLTAEQREVWRELAALAPPGVLRQADQVLLELAVRLLLQVRGREGVSPALANQLRQCLAELGMAPSARSRLSVPPPAAGNPFAELDR